MKNRTSRIRRKITLVTVFFMVSLALSGITAIPARAGASFLLDIVPASWQDISGFLLYIREALFSCDATLFYGYDWLAFAHIVIAILFYGVIRDPVRNLWVVEFGMIACVLVIPFALLMGSVRGIPIWWRLIDCSFGVFGIIPLCVVRRWIAELEELIGSEKLNIIF